MILFLDSWLQPCHKGHKAQVQLRERNFYKDFIFLVSIMGFSGGSDGKETTCNAGDLGSISGLGSSSGGGHGKPLQYSYLENPMDRRAWWATVYGVTESDTTEWLSTITGVSQEAQVVRVVKNLPANAGDVRHRFDLWVRKIPWRRAWQPTPVFLPEKSHGQKRLVGYGP